jgi:glycosyltransferase involved in cell wall biosynthesis
VLNLALNSRIGQGVYDPDIEKCNSFSEHLLATCSCSLCTVAQTSHRMTRALGHPTIAVAICTYNRNEALAVLLDALLISAAHLGERGGVGVVVVDDSTDGKARKVIERFEGRFERGIEYRISGRRNISLARNLALETASQLADWIAMTDDDCEPPPEWLAALLETQQRTGADAVSGPMRRRVPSGSPTWLTDEPFLEVGLERLDDEAELTIASTFNSMISSQWLKKHPAIRFDPALGVIGGEDMVFYRSAHAEGLRIRYSERAFVYENEPPTRATLSYQLRSFLWHGNTSYVTSIRAGSRPSRMFLSGINSMRKALVRPIVRIFHGERPQLRYCLASVLHAIGKMIGPFGIRIDHR